MTTSLPTILLDQLAWSFQLPRFANLAAFTKRVETYQHESGAKAVWNPADVVLAEPKVRVLFRHRQHSSGEYRDEVVTLHASNSSGFTAAELLCKLHESVRHALEHDPEPYLRRLKLSSQQNEEHPLLAKEDWKATTSERSWFLPPLYVLQTNALLASQALVTAPPQDLLRKVLWSLLPPLYTDMEHFADVVTKYQIDIHGNADNWDPSDLVLPCPAVSVQYEHWSRDGEHHEKVAVFHSSSPRGFSAVELLFHIHNETAKKLEHNDHHFFEGLSLDTGRSHPGDPPFYELLQGS